MAVRVVGSALWGDVRIEGGPSGASDEDQGGGASRMTDGRTWIAGVTGEGTVEGGGDRWNESSNAWGGPAMLRRPAQSSDQLGEGSSSTGRRPSE